MPKEFSGLKNDISRFDRFNFQIAQNSEPASDRGNFLQNGCNFLMIRLLQFITCDWPLFCIIEFPLFFVMSIEPVFIISLIFRVGIYRL
jgi:hypothetical protein